MVNVLLLLFLALNVLAGPLTDDLSQVFAVKRRQQVKSVNYAVYLELAKKTEEFKGKTVLEIELNHLKDNLIIDAYLKRIDQLKINDKAVSNFKVNAGTIEIPRELLLKKNKIEINYTGRASFDTRGIKRMRDETDGEEYLYTDFEPYYAHWLFPCLDQPDIKAKFQFTVKAPEDWRIINNELILEEIKEANLKTTKFHPTVLLSPYHVFLGAGPFVEWKDQHGNVPLYLHARKSLAKFVDPENIFPIFKTGLDFFATYFDSPYPFSKYGHVFVPDLTMFAVESAGAVTFHELFIFPGPVPSSRRDSRTNIILHEMAHMWFGDLVTPHWWSDLWLKEGFATYMSSLAQTRAFKMDYGRVDMLNQKTGGYSQDLYSTTHPIESEIPTARSAKGIFDGITYAKGAAAMKQLHFFVGEEGFQKGIRNYFKKFGFKNANRKEFINSIADASGKNLENWSTKWLQTAGPNIVNVNFECEKNRISKAEIIQKESSSGNLSPHKTRLGLYKLDRINLKVESIVDVTFENQQTHLQEMIGKNCPDFLLPNQDDEDYAVYGLDKKSLRHAPLALTKLPDPVARYQIWSILIQMVRNQELSPKAFMNYAIEAFKFESDESLLGIIFARQSYLKDFRLIYSNYLTVSERKAIAIDLEKTLWQRMLSAQPSSTLRLIFFDIYASISQTMSAQDRLLEILKTGKAPEGVNLDLERKWRLIRSLANNGNPEVLPLIESESTKNSSSLVRSMATASRAAYPDLKVKKEIFEKMFTQKDLIYTEIFQVALSFFSINFPEIGQKLAPDYFAKISSLNWSEYEDFIQPYFILFPGSLCTRETEDMSLKSMKNATQLTPNARKAWTEAHDELARCVKVRTKKW